MDRWDFVGIVGTALVGGGVGMLAGMPWSLIWFGAVLIVLYVVRELRA